MSLVSAAGEKLQNPMGHVSWTGQTPTSRAPSNMGPGKIITFLQLGGPFGRRPPAKSIGVGGLKVAQDCAILSAEGPECSVPFLRSGPCYGVALNRIVQKTLKNCII